MESEVEVPEAADVEVTANHGPTREVETELKFEVPRRWSVPNLAGVGRVASVEGPARMTQTATYLDTPWLDLLRAKHTLRRRTGGSDAGWHLKTPGDAEGSRVELRLPLGRSAAFVPAELRAHVADVIGQDALVPVALLRTRRARRHLLAADGAVIALVEDDTVEATTYIDGERIHRWREVEVELVDGAPQDLEPLAQALQRSGLIASDKPSKLGRALADPLAVPKPGKKDPRTAGQVVLEYVAKQVGVLQALESDVRVDAPDAVHKARVATRRLRSSLRTYRAVLDRTATDPIRSEVAWLTGALGGPRDAEVMRARILGLLDGLEDDLVVGPVRRRMADALAQEHADAHARLVAALDSRRYERLMRDLVDLLVEPPFSPAAAEPSADVLPGLVGKASKSVVKMADQAQAMPESDERDEAVHDVRKLAKAARYAAEAAGRSAGVSAAKVVDAWTDLQEALGDHQDSVVARGVIYRLADAARAAGEDTFTYGVLAEREYALARGVEERYLPLLTQARKAAMRSGKS